MRLTHCTLTGVDERTDLSELAALSDRHTHAEWGFLYSPKRQGLPGRYPSIRTLLRTLNDLPASVRVALHVCGDGVQNLLYGELMVTRLLRLVGRRGGRVQLNFNLGHLSTMMGPLSRMGRLLDDHPDVTFITQYHAQNHAAYEVLRSRSNYAVLFDRSGGTGRLPDKWPAPLSDVPCGYAGGLGPDNLADHLEVIAETAGERDIWIDMENNLRTRDAQGMDWFDLGRAGLCLDITSHSRSHDHTFGS